MSTENLTLPERLALLKQKKSSYRMLKKQYDDAKADYEAFERETFEFMEEHDHRSIRQSDGRYDLKSTVYATMQDRETFIEWCRERDLADEFLRETEEKGRLNELVRAAIDNGEELPPGVSFYTKQYISITEN